MSRALIIDRPQDHVLATCAKHDAPITSIETLPDGYTRVVFRNADAAATIGRAFRDRIVTADVRRTPLSIAVRGSYARQPQEPEPAAKRTATGPGAKDASGRGPSYNLFAKS